MDSHEEDVLSLKQLLVERLALFRLLTRSKFSAKLVPNNRWIVGDTLAINQNATILVRQGVQAVGKLPGGIGP